VFRGDGIGHGVGVEGRRRAENASFRVGELVLVLVVPGGAHAGPTGGALAGCRSRALVSLVVGGLAAR
jgi:hypothetical protein